MNDKQIIIFDSEVMHSHYLFAARRVSDGKVNSLWGHKPEDMELLLKLLHNPHLIWVGFNCNNFDIPLAIAAANGETVEGIKAMADHIIKDRVPAWLTMQNYGLEYIKKLQTIDLMEPAPGVMVSLKMYGGRMGSTSIIDMPFHHDDYLTDAEAKVLHDYCINDLDETEELYHKLTGQLSLRESMGEKYKMNLMSKSDGQMAEGIIAKQLNIRSTPQMPLTVRYTAPPFVQPNSQTLKDILSHTEAHRFNIKQSNGSVELPNFLKEKVIIGNGIYQMGVGGLHSKHDKHISYESSDVMELSEFDVAGYYPNVLLNAEFVPRGLGKPFIDIFRGFVNDRIVAKRIDKKLSALDELSPEQEVELANAKVLNNAGKLMTNSTFGKLGNRFSKIYSPDLMLAITMTGQFYLLALIEDLENMGANVISANTDGIVVAATPEIMQKARDFVAVYGWTSNFEFEENKYRSVAYKDVNNYIAVTTAGKVKSKGLYAASGLNKNPSNEVCSIAARAYLLNGTDVEETIRAHFTIENFHDFLQARTVNGGARYGDEFLGRVARWYYSTEGGDIRYRTNGNLVPRSSGGKACMKLPKTLPSDVDIPHYVEEAISHLNDMGIML